MHEIWATLCSVQWWTQNLGQVIGACAGAFLAYILGAFQTRQQISLSQLPEKLKSAKKELSALRAINRALDLVSMNTLTSEGLYIIREWDQFRSVVKENIREWDLVLEDARIADRLRYIENWMNPSCPRRQSAKVDITESKWWYTVEEAGRVKEEVAKYIKDSEYRCNRLLGLDTTPWFKKAYTWLRFKMRRMILNWKWNHRPQWEKDQDKNDVIGQLMNPTPIKGIMPPEWSGKDTETNTKRKR